MNPDKKFDPRDMESPEEINIEFTTSSNHETFYANGVYGGITPRGDMHVDFVADRSERPKSQSFKINKNGSLGRQIDEKGGEKIIRERQVSLYIKPENAFDIGAWMIAKVLPPNVEEKHVKELLKEEFNI